ncbi:MAG: ATP synthase F1 subunit delta [Candidatus Adiutrix sp.]|jgi:F-type H+-transporting ATPase subunit delta|nr:ATP synthase F1 subunit delta [Candidatus Adiutrix sp.]
MKNHTVVKRYAQALLEIGQADGQFEQYGRELQQMAGLLAEVGDPALALVSPAFPEGLRRKMLDGILKKAALSRMVDNFIRLLTDKGRLGDLGDIARAYNLLADLLRGVIRATVVSATPLDGAQVESIRDSLAKYTGRQVNLTTVEDPGIIGGLIAHLGDLSIDGSVRTQINKLSGLLNAL